MLGDSREYTAEDQRIVQSQNPIQSVVASMLHALRTRTGKDTQIVFAGEIAAAGLGFVANVILLRKMSVADYGLFSLFLSIMMMLSGLMHFGWIETYVRFGARHLDSPHFHFVRRFCLKKIVWGMVLLFVVVTLASGPICARLLNREGQEALLIAAAFGAMVSILFSFVQNDFRVRRQFSDVLILRVGSSVVRIFSYVFLWLLMGAISLFQAAAINIISLLLFAWKASWGFFRAAVPKTDTATLTTQNGIACEMRDYNFWILISFVTTTIIGNIDLQILSHYHGDQLLGNYGAATKLTLPFQMMAMAISTTVLPRLSMMRDSSDMLNYLRKITLFVVPVALLLGILIFLAPPVLIWLAGPSYAGISTAIKLQLGATLIIFLANPVGLVLTAWGWSRFFAILNIVQLFLDIILDLLWIPRYGVEGALAATLVINIVGLVVIYVGLWTGFRQRKP